MNVKAENGKTVLLLEDPKILEFINKQSSKSRQTYKTCFRKLMEFDPSITGEGLLRDKLLWERTRIFEFRNWLIEKKGLSENFAVGACGAVRGFFSHNRMRLELTQSETKTLGRRSRTTESYFFTKEDLSKMWHVADLTEKWVLCNKSLGMRAEDFVRITWSNLRTLHLDEEAPVTFGEFASIKEGTKYHSFLDADCVGVVRELIELNKDKKNSERVFTAKDRQLSYIVQKLTAKANIEIGTKKVSMHSLRKYLQDRLTNYMSEIKADMIIGHSTGSNVNSAYTSTNELKECFTRAMPDLLLNGNGNGQVKKDLAETKTTVEALVKMLADKDKVILDLTQRLDVVSTKTATQETRMDELAVTVEGLKKRKK